MMRAAWSIVCACIVLLSAFVLEGCAPDDAEANMTQTVPSSLARGVVDVQGGLISVRPRHAGSLIEIAAHVGQEVSRGTVLARLEGIAQNAEADAARAGVERARAELSSERLKVNSLQEALARVREAVELGAESAHVRDELQAQLDAAVGALPVAQAAVAEAAARLRAAQSIADGTLLRAPDAGRVVQLNAHVGDIVGAADGPPVFLLRPNAPLIVRASLAARDISRIQVGAAVEVSEADDRQNAHEGRVLWLGEIVRKPDPTIVTDDFMSDRVIDCTIELEPDANIRIGTLVLVSFPDSASRPSAALRRAVLPR